MVRVESGPAQADRNWRLGQFAFFLLFTGYFIVDGAWLWPASNRDKGKEAILGKVDAADRAKVTDALFDETPEEPQFKTLFDRVAASETGGKRVTRDEVHEIVGQPDFVKTTGPGQTRELFVSLYGHIVVELDNGVVRDRSAVGWQKPSQTHTRSEIKGQFYWAMVPGIGSLAFLWMFYRAATLRVVVDDRGLTYCGKHIPTDKITSVRDYNPKGWVDVYHTAEGPEKRLRLDWEKIKEFEPLVEALAQLKGVENPITAFRARQEAESVAGS